jgi:hypothetical protein
MSVSRQGALRPTMASSYGNMEEFIQNGLKIFKIFRQSQQSTTWPIRDPATVDFSRES